MKDNFIHVCFILDESGSMGSSVSDVCGGFNKILEEQKALTEGTCAFSLYKFSGKVSCVYRGRDVSEISPLTAPESVKGRWWMSSPRDLKENEYYPCGGTALYDGVGQAIDEIGAWLAGMPEEERPEKNLIVIMTDGEENSSRKYSLEKVRGMIKHQEDVYSWTFVFQGTDITTTETATRMGFANQSYATREDHLKNYNIIGSVTACYRSTVGDSSIKASALNSALACGISEANRAFEEKTNIKISDN